MTMDGLRSPISAISSQKKNPDFDSRTYGYSKLSDLISASPLFDLIRHSPQEGKPKGIYVRDKRRGEGENSVN